MTDTPMPKYPGLPFTGKRGEPREVARPLNSTLAPLMRQLRKYEAYHACLAVLDELFAGDLDGLAAPHELRLAPPAGTSARAASGPTADRAEDELHTLFLLVANQTVESVIAQKAKAIVERVNSRLKVAMVEQLRCEQAPLLKVQRQLEILRLEPA